MLHTSSLVSKYSVGRFAATRLIQLIRDVFFFFGHAFSEYFLFSSLLVPRFLDRCIFFYDFLNVTAAQTPFHLNNPHGFLVLLQKVTHADASLFQQRLAKGKIRPGQNICSVKVISATYAISLQRSGQYIHSIKMADTSPAISLKRSGKYIHPIELADAHPTISLPWFRGTIELTDTHSSVPEQRLSLWGSVRCLADAGLSLALQQFRGFTDLFKVSLCIRFNGGIRHGIVLGKHQELEIERAFRASWCTLTTWEQRCTGANEHAVLPQPRLTRSIVQFMPRRIIIAEYIAFRKCAPILRTKKIDLSNIDFVPN